MDPNDPLGLFTDTNGTPPAWFVTPTTAAQTGAAQSPDYFSQLLTGALGIGSSLALASIAQPPQIPVTATGTPMTTNTTELVLIGLLIAAGLGIVLMGKK